MKKFLLAICFCLIFVGCASLPPSNVHDGWTKQDFDKISDEEKIFDFTFAGFQFHYGVKRIMRVGEKIPLAYHVYVKHINVKKLVKSLKDTYDITVNPEEFIQSRNKKFRPKQDGRWLNWFWRGTHKRNRLGLTIILYSAQEGFRTTPRVKIVIYYFQRSKDGKLKVVATDQNDTPIGDTTGFSKDDVFKAISENSFVKRPKVKVQ